MTAGNRPADTNGDSGKMSHYTTYDPDNDYSHEPDEREQFDSRIGHECYDSMCIHCGASYSDKTASRVDKWENEHVQEGCK